MRCANAARSLAEAVDEGENFLLKIPGLRARAKPFPQPAVLFIEADEMNNLTPHLDRDRNCKAVPG
jgi:hypothetical protein